MPTSPLVWTSLPVFNKLTRKLTKEWGIGVFLAYLSNFVQCCLLQERISSISNGMFGHYSKPYTKLNIWNPGVFLVLGKFQFFSITHGLSLNHLNVFKILNYIPPWQNTHLMILNHTEGDVTWSISTFILCIFFFFCFFRVTLVAYGGSPARSLIGAVAPGLHQSHSKTGSELCLWRAPQLMATPDP